MNNEQLITTDINPPKRKRGRPPKISKAQLPTSIAASQKPSEPVNSEADKNARLHKLMLSGGSKYDTFDIEVYQNRLDNMTLNELHDEAIRIGLKPLGDRSLTTRTLLELFNEERRRFTPNAAAGVNDTITLSQDKFERLSKIMRDAR